MTRHTVAGDIPNSGPSSRMVRFVREYTATSSTRSGSGRHHGQPPPGPFPPRSLTTVTSFANRSIRKPVNVSTHTGSARSTPPLQEKCLGLSLRSCLSIP